jgi:hypothetical protein
VQRNLKRVDHFVVNADEATVQGLPLWLEEEGSISSFPTKCGALKDFLKLVEASSPSAIHHVVNTIKFQVLHRVVVPGEHEVNTPLVVREAELFLRP